MKEEVRYFPGIVDCYDAVQFVIDPDPVGYNPVTAVFAALVFGHDSSSLSNVINPDAFKFALRVG